MKRPSRRAAPSGVEVDAARLERRALEATQRASKLLVGAAVNATTDRAKKCVERERDDAIVGAIRFVIAAKELDVDVLVERAGNAVAGRREDAPASSRFGSVRDRRVIGRIAQAK